MPRLIGLTGPAGAGKDTVAESLVITHNFRSYAFADPLYDALAAMLQFHESKFRDRAQKERVIPELGVSPRRLLQTLGTEWGRNLINEDWWVMLARQRVKTLSASGYSVVVSDVRFQNELEMIRDMGGKVIRVERESVPQVSEHISENPGIWMQADYAIDNNGTLDDLREQVWKAMEYLDG